MTTHSQSSRTTSGFVFAAAVAACTFLGRDARAAGERTLEDFRYFRALSIDLQGRIPTRPEISAFEDPRFDLDGWIDTHLEGSAYSERLQRVYMDALRLEVGESFRYVQNANVLRRYPVLVDNGDGTQSTHWVYWRRGQRRSTAALDRNFCFMPAETGSTYAVGRAPVPDMPPTAVPLAMFQARTKAVKPWWMYRDYRTANPTSFYSKWATAEPRFVLNEPKERKGAAVTARDTRMLVAPDGSAMTSVFTCAEEAQETEQATAKVRGQNVDVACATGTGYLFSEQCGCGKGLEACMPGSGFGNDPPAMVLPSLAPLGLSQPFESAREQQGSWWRGAWGEEVRHFLGSLFLEDRDFRDVLTAKYGWMNGPTAQFYRGVAAGDCCNDLLNLGPGVEYVKPETVVDLSRIPSDLVATEMDRWVKVEDRGPHASGLLTMPAFLAKFASRRGRAHAVYTAFLCKDFVAENLQLQPSTEPNLMIRSGCSTCHATLEPMAAYFARTKEAAFDWLKIPMENATCALKSDGTMTDACERYYDPSFSTVTTARLRGAYGSPANAEKGPAGLASEVVASPEFATCAARTVTESMLGRASSNADDVVLRDARAAFVDGGFKMRPLMRAIVKSNAYRNANATLVKSGGAK